MIMRRPNLMFMSMWRMNVLLLFILAPLGTILAQKAPTETAGVQNVPALQQRNPRYQVMPSDVMVVAFPLSPELNQETVTVQPDGFIALSNVGSIYVQGLTTPEIVEALKKAYAKILHDPIIDVYLT